MLEIIRKNGFQPVRILKNFRLRRAPIPSRIIRLWLIWDQILRATAESVLVEHHAKRFKSEEKQFQIIRFWRCANIFRFAIARRRYCYSQIGNMLVSGALLCKHFLVLPLLGGATAIRKSEICLVSSRGQVQKLFRRLVSNWGNAPCDVERS